MPPRRGRHRRAGRAAGRYADAWCAAPLWSKGRSAPRSEGALPPGLRTNGRPRYSYLSSIAPRPAPGAPGKESWDGCADCPRQPFYSADTWRRISMTDTTGGYAPPDQDMRRRTEAAILACRPEVARQYPRAPAPTPARALTDLAAAASVRRLTKHRRLIDGLRRSTADDRARLDDQARLVLASTLE